MMENIDIHTVVNAMLVHVPFDGWTDKAMEAAGQDLNLSADDLAKLFPRGAISAVEAFVSMSDQDMIKAFAALEHRPDGVTATIKSANHDQTGCRRSAPRSGITGITDAGTPTTCTGCCADAIPFY
jgi:ubiquinone biosynthesis protein COQ9